MLMTRVRPAAATGALVLERLRAQLVLGVLLGFVVPLLFLLPIYLHGDDVTRKGIENSALGSLIAIVLAVLMYRRVTSFPGIRAFRFVLPTYAGTFGTVLTIFLALRIDYNRPLFGTAFALSLSAAIVSAFYVLRRGVRRFYLVPFGRYDVAFNAPNTEWVVMTAPQIPDDPQAIIVADLRFDHEQEWEQMLAHAAVAGHPVYHIKQLRESLTGRVSIEHISENSFGSMLPNLAYCKAKRVIDLVAALVALPVLFVPLLLVALAIKLDSPGPVLFRQQRMGYRGHPFSIFKFRTMHAKQDDAISARVAAMTGDQDPRVTRIGRFLRHSRIDELPQILNIISGDMSWIGPRPEAVPLSRWYEEEIPFYFYRHIVRPGITGWAQVNQGHVSDIESVSTKLGYDFYYIQNFSAWIDVLITLRTINTMLNGFGSR